jgi:hypothetical protein
MRTQMVTVKLHIYGSKDVTDTLLKDISPIAKRLGINIDSVAINEIFNSGGDNDPIGDYYKKQSEVNNEH